MAEIVGLAASTIAIAQVGGKILTTSLSIKQLLEDVKELPETFSFLLDQIQVLTPVFIESNTDTAECPPVAASRDRALGAAISQCNKALYQLKALLSDLTAQLESSKGLKRRLTAVKLVLRKDVITKHEKRLHTAVQLLSIAQQTYILTLQRQQPALIVSQLVRALEARQELEVNPQIFDAASETTEKRTTTNVASRGVAQANIPVNIPARGLWRFARDVRTISIGVPGVTGVMTVRIPSAQAGSHDLQHKEEPEYYHCLLELKIRLPTWLSSRLTESTIYQTHWGWTHHFRTYNTFYGRGTPWQLAVAAIKTGDLPGLKRLFQDRILTPFDRWRPDWKDDAYSEESILGVAMKYGAWSICNYLTAKEVDTVTLSIAYPQSIPETEERLHQLTRFLQHDGLSEATRLCVLSYASLSPRSFANIRRSIWPDDEFYAEANRYSRMQLAIDMMYHDFYEDLHSTSQVVRLILSRNGFLSFEDVVDASFLGRSLCWSLLSILATRMAQCKLNMDIDRLSTFKALLTDILPFAKHSHEIEALQNRGCSSLNMKLKSLLAFIGGASFPSRPSSATRLAELALETWLEVLEAAAVDLERYGEVEVPALTAELRQQEFFTQGERKSSGSSATMPRLCCMQYGPRPADWRLWWTEPTDEFVGDFWRAIEFEVPRLPGSWVEDEDIGSPT